MKPLRWTLTAHETGSGIAVRLVREDGAAGYGFHDTQKDKRQAAASAAGMVLKEVWSALEGDDTGSGGWAA